MTTKEAAMSYELEHRGQMAGRKVAIYNPHEKPVNELPTIYGFNNGGSPGWFSALLIAEDGTELGGHVCSSEAYMPHDLGILEGTRLDRHDKFREHYPNGYRMQFVAYTEVGTNDGIQAAFKQHAEKETARTDD